MTRLRLDIMSGLLSLHFISSHHSQLQAANLLSSQKYIFKTHQHHNHFIIQLHFSPHKYLISTQMCNHNPLHQQHSHHTPSPCDAIITLLPCRPRQKSERDIVLSPKTQSYPLRQGQHHHVINTLPTTTNLQTYTNDPIIQSPSNRV